MATKNIITRKIRKNEILRNLKSLGILGLIVIGIALMLSGGVSAYNIQGSGVCDCNSCDDCVNALNDNISCNKEVRLTVDITNYTGTCINNPKNFNNKTFDCQEHIIDGNNSGDDYGIYLYKKSDNTIKNCVITDFLDGISLSSSSNSTLTNNTAKNNNYGIYLYSSSNTAMRNNTMKNNTYNFNIGGGKISDFYQDIDTSNLVDDKPIYYLTNEKNAPNSCKNAEISDVNNTGFVALVSCDNITVKNSNLTKNSEGILLVNTTNSKILNNTLNNNSYYGIYLYSSSNNTIISNNLYNNSFGIYVNKFGSNTITHNKITYNREYGILLQGSSNNNITYNNISNNGVGIRTLESSNNNITLNNISDNFRGIMVCKSKSETVTCNSMINSGIIVWSGGSDKIEHWNSHTIENNTVNGKTIYYFKNKVGEKVPENAGQIILANCTGMRIENLNISNTDVGIEVGFSDRNAIRNVNISNTKWNAVVLWHSSENNITSNNVSNNSNGILLDINSSNNNISSNSISNNDMFGILISGSSNNNISSNNISDNLRGIMFLNSISNIATHNSMINDGIVMLGNKIEYWNSHTIKNNTVNGKPAYYLKNKVGENISENAGQIILVNCTRIRMENLNISNTDVGIEVGFSTGTTIRNVTVSNNNWLGIMLFKSINNNITYNSMLNNWWCGILLHESANYNNITYNTIFNNSCGIQLVNSNNNILYLNNFINNEDNIRSPSGLTNIWHSPTKINYTYNCKNYANYLGNYWSNYSGNDGNNDGVRDSPYTDSNNEDNYPLVQPFENYFTPPALSILYVDNNFNSSTQGWQCDHFASIQDAINVSAENGTVYVFNGTYYENIVINKSITLKSENGSAKCIIDGSKSGNTVTITADHVTIEGFMIINGTYGIYINHSRYNIIANNTVNNNSYDGIYLDSSSNNTIINNTVNSNNCTGIYIFNNSNFNRILGNKISNNNQAGITISNCDRLENCDEENSNNTIEGNEILNNTIGIFSNASNSTINNNLVCGNAQSDFNSTDWLSSYGDKNTCDKPDGWNDKGRHGCSYCCGGDIPKTYYRDFDGDGYGNLTNNIASCLYLTGYVNNSQDCNDNNSSIHPGAADIIDNGIDENCDGIIDQCNVDSDCGSGHYCSNHKCYKESTGGGGYTGAIDYSQPAPSTTITTNKEFNVSITSEIEGLTNTLNLGKDASGANVIATVGNKTSQSTANANGTVTITLLGYGQGEITISKSGYKDLTKTINVYAGALNIAKLSGEKYGDEFKFKVTTKDGNPVKDAAVEIYGKTLKTDASGIAKMTITTIQQGLEAFASTNDYKGSSASFDVKAIGTLKTNVPEKVTKGDTITITVTDESNNPVPNAKVIINGVEQTADTNGKIEYKVTTDSLTLKAESEGYIPSEQTSVSVKEKVECGNGKCEAETGETKENCPQDCIKCGDGVCDKGETYENCSSDCPKPSDNTLLIIVVILIVVIVLMAVYYLMRKGKGRKEESK